jgi:hypothetical protein
MKTKLISYKPAPVADLNNICPAADGPRTLIVLLLRALKKLTKTMMIKGRTQIDGRTQFWKNISTPFYGHSKAWWPGYLPADLVSGVLPARGGLSS